MAATRFAAIVIMVLWPGPAGAVDQAVGVQLARSNLASDDNDEREALAAKLAGYKGEIEPVLEKLSSRRFEPVEAGYLPEEHFSVTKLLEKHADDLLYFTIPKSYRPDRATGLIVFMHGGGNKSSRNAPRGFMNFTD